MSDLQSANTEVAKVVKQKKTRQEGRKEPLTVTPEMIKSIKASLASGKTRSQIFQELGLNATEGNYLFKHPELKGLKVHRDLSHIIQFVDEAGNPINPISEADTAESNKEAADEATSGTESSAPVAETTNANTGSW